MADIEGSSQKFESLSMTDQDDDMEGESLTQPGKQSISSTVVYDDPIANRLLEI